MAIEMSNLANGTDITALAASKLTGALPAIDGSALTGLSGGGISGSQLFTSSGTWNWNAAGQPSTVYVTVVGGGGGGGGANTSGSAYCGSGGGGGGTSIETVAVTGNTSVTVGSGGSAGGFNANGGTGGASSFGSVSASGGAGGSRRTSQTNYGSGGAGGAGTFRNGGRGGYRYPSASYTPGGGSIFSIEEDLSWYGSTTSRVMAGYGTGGFGRYAYTENNGQFTAGAGTAGVVLVTW